jgi:cytochrome c oxidase cbb3-type subunit I/II
VTGAPIQSAQQASAVDVVYSDRVARQFVVASLAWGVLGMAVGLLVALQLVDWRANLPPALTFGRLRPLHTSTVVFAFAGNMIFAGVYHASQRLLRVALPSRRLAALHFWSWQLCAAAAAVTLPLGHTRGVELAELAWPIDVLLGLSWLVFATHFFWMIARRHQRRLHPAIWFIIATIVGFGAAHAVSSLDVPVGALESYPLLGGVQGALVASWHGEAGVTFFLTVPVLGLLYYFLPRAAGQPIYSHRLAILHFWAVVAIFGWAAPRHLLDTALPDWAQSAGAAFGLLLWAALWAGVVNGLLTVRGAWSRLRGEPSLPFFVAALLFHGLAALEGSLLSFKSVAGLAHYTDWTIGHVHATALGFDGLVAAGLFYWLVPRLYGTRLRSAAAAGAHFYAAVVGILVYLSSMWIAGATEGLMWRAEGATGGMAYSFLEAVAAVRLLYWARLAGGALYLGGFLLMIWNLARTIRGAHAASECERVEIEPPAAARDGLRRLVLAKPVLIAASVTGLVVAAGFTNALAALGLFLLAFLLAMGGISGAVMRDPARPGWHERIEGRALALTLLIAAAAWSGGVVEIAPLLARPPEPVPGETAPYSPLQLEGRDIYIAEGCRACHSQMIRPFLWEVARYGEVSSTAESLLDHPFQWGSRRIGPDLARIGGRYPSLWHYQHLVDPRSVTPGSIMPPYPHLVGERIDFAGTAAKMRALRAAGVPYDDRAVGGAASAALAEARAIAADLEKTGQIVAAPDSAVVALIAYLQRLGQPP